MSNEEYPEEPLTPEQRDILGNILVQESPAAVAAAINEPNPYNHPNAGPPQLSLHRSLSHRSRKSMESARNAAHNQYPPPPPSDSEATATTTPPGNGFPTGTTARPSLEKQNSHAGSADRALIQDDAATGTEERDLEKGEQPEKPGAGGGAQAPVQLSKLKFWLIFFSQMLSIFLFALDQLILATAIPYIVTDFQHLDEIPWIVNGFFLTLLAGNLLYSQFLSFMPSKTVLLIAIFLFELGSLLSGVAPNMTALIWGRAVSGLGAGGLFTANIVILAEYTTMRERAKYMGLIGISFAAASILGPLVGGALTQHPSWRWCFYINLPIGGLAAFLLFILLPHLPPLGRRDEWKGYGRHMLWDLARCDWFGSAIVLAWATCLILALQWGGASKSWSNGSVIACLVMIPVLGVLFVLYEWWLGPERAMMPLFLYKNRTVVGACIISGFLFAAFTSVIYYLSEEFQAVFQASPTGAGVKLLPMICTQIFALIFSGRVIAKFGNYYPFLIVGSCLTTIGCGLLYSIKYGTSIQHYLGYQVFLGLGIGCCLQNVLIVLQWEYDKQPKMISKATGVGTFTGFIGRILGLSLASSVFDNLLPKNLQKYAPELPADVQQAVLNEADAVWKYVPEALRPAVLRAYIDTSRAAYAVGIPCGIICLFGVLLIRRKQERNDAEHKAQKEAKKAKKEQEKAEKEAAKKKLDNGEGVETPAAE